MALTQDQITQQVMAAGYNGPTDQASINAAYARTATPADLAASGLGASPTNNNTGTATGTNPTLAQAVMSNLQQKAYQEYLNAKLALDTDQEAYQKAAQSIANDLSVAGVTGTYNGMPTQQAIKQIADIASQQAATMLSYATTFGSWGMPQQGQMTQAAEKQAFDMSNQAAQLTGWYTPYNYTPPTAGSMPSQFSGGISSATTGAQAGPGPYGAAGGAGAGGTGGAAAGGGMPSQDQYVQARTQQLMQVAGMSQQQAQGTAQSEWSQNLPQSGNVAYGLPPGVSFAQPGSTATSTLDQWRAARIPQLVATGMDQNQAMQTAEAEWTQGYAQSGNVAYGMPSGYGTPTPGAGGAAGSGGLPTAPGQFPDSSAALGVPPGYQAGQPVETLAANQQRYQQWLDSQKEAAAEWQQQQTAAQNYLNMLAGLRGPADYAKYQQVLGATPGGMKDLVAAAAGQYIPGGGATTGVAPTPVNLQNFVGSATGQGAADTNGQAAMNSLVAPNQMAPQTWNALTPSQQQMLLGTWESQGYTKDDAQALFNQSLPKYATGAPASGSFKLT